MAPRGSLLHWSSRRLSWEAIRSSPRNSSSSKPRRAVWRCIHAAVRAVHPWGRAVEAQWICHLTGGKLVLQNGPSFDAKRILSLVAEEEVSTMSLVGDAMAIPLVEELKNGDYDMSNLAVIYASGGGDSFRKRSSGNRRAPARRDGDQQLWHQRVGGSWTGCRRRRQPRGSPIVLHGRRGDGARRGGRSHRSRGQARSASSRVPDAYAARLLQSHGQDRGAIQGVQGKALGRPR